MSKKNQSIFALDIGTRSIVGIIMEKTQDEQFNIKDIVMEEHVDRAMLDGQIHNIPQVSSLISKIKAKLEKNTKGRLKKVAVAAAGRSLRTIKAKTVQEMNNQEVITTEDVLNLELKGAQQAQAMLLDNYKDNVSNYYCVGYSVTNYYLDGDKIGSLVGQKGEKIGLEIVATFLPKVVVDSLQAVIEANGLELSSITLEPIAAINAILPPTMRKLNLALVDVGAGTSDIAISLNGSITAYGMVPVAGDEITEALCEKYLLDFNVGENVKRKLNSDTSEKVEFVDILGFEQVFSSSEIISSIDNSVKELAKKISDEILALNNKATQAVILIGGGSLTPLLALHIADLLGLPEQRVAVQKASSIKNLTNLPNEFSGPEYITPMGIGITALKYITLGFIHVQVNKHNINMLNLGKNTVFDALLSAGVEVGKLYGKPGLALTVEVNGEIKIFPGSKGEKAVIKVNGQEASLDTILKPKDKVEFLSGKNGTPGQGLIRDILPLGSYLTLNGQKKKLPYEITMNGKIVSEEAELIDGGKIFFREITQIGELLELWESEHFAKMKSITIIINGQTQKRNLLPLQITLNEKTADIFTCVNGGDKLQIAKSKIEYSVKSILNIIKPDKKLQNEVLKVTVNDKLLEFPLNEVEIFLNNKIVTNDEYVDDGDVIEIKSHPKKTPILIDIFPKIDFSVTPPTGKSRLEMLINGVEAEYTAPLKDNDTITLQWY